MIALVAGIAVPAMIIGELLSDEAPRVIVQHQSFHGENKSDLVGTETNGT